MVSDSALLVAITIYLIVIALILHAHPEMLFNRDGTYKEFGVGRPGRTVFPFWLVAVALAPFSYLAALHITRIYGW